MKKKFLSLFTLLIVIVCAVAFVACEDYGNDKEEEETTTNPTYTHTVKNGTFYNSTTTSTETSGDKAVLDKVTDWTQMSASTTTSKTGADGVLSAVIDVSDEEKFNALAEKYFRVYEDSDGNELDKPFTMANPGVDPKTPMVNKLDADGKIVTDEKGDAIKQKEDTNVFAIASTKKEGSLYATSSSFTLEKDSRYLLQFSVCSKIDVEDGNTEKGAWFVLSGDMEYTIKNINTNGEWKTYYLFIETNRTNSMSLTAQMWLGYGPGISTSTTNPDDKGKYSTRGVVFFDNVLCEKVDDSKLTTAISDNNIATYGEYTYNAEDKMVDNFAEFKSAINSTKDSSGNKYVTAKSAYYLTNTDMELRKKPTSYNTSSYRKYFYSFRENTGSSNLNKFSVSSSGTYDAKYYGSVDVSKLYNIVTDETVDLTTVTDNYSKSTTDGGIGTTSKFYAMGYEEWKNDVMNDSDHNLSDMEETYVMMLYNRDLMANTIKTSEKIKIDANKYYEISIWAYVWAKQYDNNKYYPKFDEEEPADPREGGTNGFSSREKYLFNLLYNDIASMNGFEAELTTEEKEKEKDHATALTNMGKWAYKGTASETIRTASASWIRDLLGLENTTDIGSLGEDLYYTYLYKNLSSQSEEVKAKESDIEKLYLHERVTLTTTYKKSLDKFEKYEEEYEDWKIEKSDYEAKYENWASRNPFPKATVKLTGAGDGLEEQTTVLGQWERITFYIQGNQLSSRQLTLEMALGTGRDDSTYMIGGAFFDNISIKEYDDKANSGAPAGTNWERLSEIGSENEISFGGLTGSAELNESIANDIITANWEKDVADGTASADINNVNLSVSAGELGTIEVENTNRYLYVLDYENTKATASTLTYKGESTIKIMPNKFYRLAFLVKTENIDKDLGITINLLYGEDPNSITEKKDSTVTKYTNNTEEWAEVVYYISGDLLKTYYVAISVDMGSGTRFVTTNYVSGKVSLTAFNCLEIDYEEYNSASTGDKIVKGVSLYNIKESLDESDNAFSNSYYSKLDYDTTEEKEFDENGEFVGIGVTKDWTVSSAIGNSYDKVKDLTLSGTKLTWSGAEGRTSSIDGNIISAVPEKYEIWMKYTDKDGTEKEELYDIVEKNTNNDDYSYDFSIKDTINNWATTKLTYFAVNAIGKDGISGLCTYSTGSMGTSGKEGEPKAVTTEKPTKARAGTVAVAEEMFGEVDGVSYVSPYDTVMKLTSNYNSIISISSKTLSSGLKSDGYYKISVWVKTDIGTYASITLGETSGALQATTDNSKLGFVQITTDGEWREYCMFIKTGNFNAKMNIKYTLGNPYAEKRSGKIGAGESENYYLTKDFSKGNAYFDAVKVTTITEEEYNSAKQLDSEYEGTGYASTTHEVVYTTIPYYVFIMEYVVDSFDANEAPSTTTTDNDKTGNTPSNYNRDYDKDLTKDGTLATYGVYDINSENQDMITAIKQLYMYKDTDEDEDVFVYNEIFGNLLGDSFNCKQWDADDWNAFMETFLSINRKDTNGTVVYDGGNNVLVMSNKAESGYAQHYSLDSTYNYKVAKNSYTKITFSARTLIARLTVTESTDSSGNTIKDYDYFLDNAYGEFRVNPSSSNDKEINVKINSYEFGDRSKVYDDVTYTVYLNNPTEEENTLNWSFYLGDEKDENEKKESWLDQYIVGLMAVDLVSAESITEAEYNQATSSAGNAKDKTVYFYTYEDKEEEEEEEPETDEEEPEKEDFWDKLFANEYFWLYISSFIIAIAIIVTVIVVLVKKWKKKHPKEVVGENVVKTEKDIKVVPTVSKEKEEALEVDEYTDTIKNNYVKRVNNKKQSRKNRKKK